MDLALAVAHLLPDADYRRADDYASLVETWHDSRPIPTEAELLAAWEVIESEREAAAARKIWPTVSEFWAEFTNAEKYGIETSLDPEVTILRADLKLWLRDVWSDDPRIVYALGKLVTVGILTEPRRAAILAKPPL